MTSQPPPPGDEGLQLAPFKTLLLQSCGHTFESGRESALAAAVRRRMTALGLAGLQEYHALLLRDRDELTRLTELLTVNETYFFREPDHLNLMVDSLLPQYRSARAPGPVRILSAGCSTGEEPYSVAIMLRERFGPECERLFAISGVDIDSTVIASARQGVYGKGSFREMDPVRQERYFEPRGPDRFQVKEEIRRQVTFEVVNLLDGAYPQGMHAPDVILYRNVSIYFPHQVQREIFGKLAELLSDGGTLLVGAAETIHHDLGILSLVKQDALFYFRKKTMPFVMERRGERRRIAPPEPAPKKGGAAAVFAGESARRNAQGGTQEPPRKAPVARPAQDLREWFDDALEFARKNQQEKALILLDSVVARDATFLKAYALKGSILLGISRFDEARAVCGLLLDRDPLCLEAYLMLGIIARQKGADDEALRRFREAIYLDASCWPAHFYTAEIGYAQRDEKRARNGYEAAVRILEKDSLEREGQRFFPLSFNAMQFVVICRHKLSLLKKNG